MDSISRAKKTGKARIPDHLRRRALVSCDRCKKRRIRCLRQPGNDGSEACQTCLEVGTSCTSILPRKTRIYGSVETLSIRYRVLDALIKGLYPDRDTNNIDTLCVIADSLDIPLPPLGDPVTDEVFSQTPIKQSVGSPRLSRDGIAGSPSITLKDDNGQASTPNASKVIDEKLVPLPHGPSHYIGPSSSFGFVLTVRNMVAEFTAALRAIQPDDERSKLAREFAGSNWSKALEPINRLEESDESALSVEDHLERQATLLHSHHQMQQDGLPAFPGSVNSTALPQRSRRATVQSFLPSREVTDACIKAFFEKVHPNYLLFHQPTFQARYEYAWSQPSPLMRDVEPGWICGIFMVLVFGAQVMEDHDKPQSIEIQRHYLNLVQSRLHQLISATTSVNVQALLLLQLYQHNYTERNSAFMLLGCASRMAMALGMHREGTSGGFDEIEREMRKRLWWTIYLFEQNQCAILGRPCAIDDMEVNVGFPNETMLDGGESVPVGYVESSVSLIRLMSDIRRKIYAAPSSPTQQGEFPKIGIALQFLFDLDSWIHSLPQCLRLDYLSKPRHRRAVLFLHIQFHHIQSLVSRPFLLRKVRVQLARKLGKHVRSQDLDKEEMNMSHACGTFSRKCMHLLEQLLELGMFDGVAWLDAYYVYHSVFILALDFLARPWDDQETAEDAHRKQAVRKIVDALQSVKLCPTFSILTQVSLQLAKIVGIFDVRAAAPAVEKTEPYNPYLDTPQVAFPSDYGGQSSQRGVENVVNSWFQKEPVELPWDLKEFLGVDGYVGAGPGDHYSTLPSTLGGTFHSHHPGVEEDHLMPPQMAYTQWGSTETDTPFQANRMMQTSNTKPTGGMNMGDMMR